MPFINNACFIVLLFFAGFQIFSSNCFAQQTALWHAQTMLLNIMQNKPVVNNLTEIADISQEALEQDLFSDSLKKTFWIYIYNSMVQLTLTDSVSRANEKVFFRKKVIKVAGKELSLYDIENGMLRKSRSNWFKMYQSKWFVSDYEKKLRVSKRDWRVFFALNTGVLNDPIIWFYMPDVLELEIEKQVLTYLSKNNAEGIVKISHVFKRYLNDAAGLETIVKWAESKKVALSYFSYKAVPGRLHIRKFPTIPTY